MIGFGTCGSAAHALIAMTESEARAIAAPDSWPWPMSEEAEKWVRSAVGAELQASTPESPAQQGAVGGAVVGGEWFDCNEHERFKRGLG